MISKIRFALPLIAVLGATPAVAADPIKGFFFRLERSSQKVEGLYSVGGYSLTEITGMMRKYCKGGKIGQIAHVGKARKRRGQVLQKFETTCAGGMPERFKGKSAGIEIEYITKNNEYKGKHLVEITTSDGRGNIVTLRETIQP
ncbi:hypothetical protein [Primorskyibacter sp. 2E233]|uniref:hypothetical protein n=1 Tax=Primorskyibacter sp. 2E233 TaxID=3413431 RepID=UPI003BF1A010